MRIPPSVNAHIRKPTCAYTEARFRLPYMRMLASHIRKRAHIYGISLLYMRILPSVYVHIRKAECAYTEESFRICAFWLPYMRIYESQNAHIRKLSFVYAHSAFRVCAFWLPYMRIYGRQNAHIWIVEDFSSVGGVFPERIIVGSIDRGDSEGIGESEGKG